LAHLWDRLGVTVDNVRLAPRQHRGNVVFCGYADIILWIFASDGLAIPLVHLCGNSIKLMGDQLHFDPKSERGKGTRSDHFFAHWLPAGAESRHILTRKLSELPEMQEMIQNTRAQLAQTGGSA
jgi:hypothetical protein